MRHRTYTGRTLTDPTPQPPTHVYKTGCYWDNYGASRLVNTPSTPKVVLVGPSEISPEIPMVDFTPNSALYPSRENFKLEVQGLKQKGKSVYLVLDGKSDLVIDSRTATQLVQECQDILATYGFDGLALRVSDIPSQTFLVHALEQLAPFKVALIGPAENFMVAKYLNLVKALSTTLSLVIPEFGATVFTPAMVSGVVDNLCAIVSPDKVLMSLTSDDTALGFIPQEDFMGIWDAIVKGVTFTHTFTPHWNLFGVAFPTQTLYTLKVEAYILGLPQPKPPPTPDH